MTQAKTRRVDELIGAALGDGEFAVRCTCPTCGDDYLEVVVVRRVAEIMERVNAMFEQFGDGFGEDCVWTRARSAQPSGPENERNDR